MRAVLFTAGAEDDESIGDSGPDPRDEGSFGIE